MWHKTQRRKSKPLPPATITSLSLKAGLTWDILERDQNEHGQGMNKFEVFSRSSVAPPPRSGSNETNFSDYNY